MNRTTIRLVSLALPTLLYAHIAAGVEVADVFGPEMVLQRDAPAPVWGKAEPGESVAVTFAGQSKTATADANGRWAVKLGPMPASAQPRPLVVKGASKPLAFENVRVGEVWLMLCYGIGRQYTCEGEIPNDNTRIRDVGASRKNHSPTPQEAFGRTQAWGPSRFQRFDVLSIPFANRLTRELGVPVGIVRVKVGDLDATIPVQGFAAIPALDDVAQRVSTWYPTTQSGKRAYGAWFAKLKEWRKTLARKVERGESIAPTQPPLAPGPVLGDAAQPTVVFNRQLHPLAPFAFRGALYIHNASSQADAACTKDPRHAHKMRALIAGLRIAFGRPDLAVAFTQRDAPDIYHAHTLGGHEKRDVMNFDAWHGHRDRQRRALPFENAGMVVTVDVENHSAHVAERLAGWALAQAYGKGAAASGPLYKSHRIDGDRVTLEFDYADGGLMAAAYPEIGRPLVEQKGAPLRFFAVAGADRIFRRAEARIEGKTVIVRSRRVAKPVAVRYASHFDPRGMNLYNRAGLPASPFSTDDWPIGTLGEAVEACVGKSPAELVARLGYPTMLHSHAAAKALAAKGEATVLPIIERLAASADPDERCGALRALGYLYWMGPVPRNYYGVAPQTVTPAIAEAVSAIGKAAGDADPLVRRCAAEAASLIGAENDDVFAIIRKLAVDDDPLVRMAAVRSSKYRFKTHAHNTGVAYAVLREKPFGDRTSACLAGSLLNHYRLKGPIDPAQISRYLQRIGPGRGGNVVSSLGDTLRRIKLPDGRPGLNHPDVLPGLLHVYALGYRDYMLYGVERWIAYRANAPAFRKKVEALNAEIERLRRGKPEGWADLCGRYADAVEGLKALIEKAETAKK